MPSDVLAATLLLSSVSNLQLDVLAHWLMIGQQRGLSGAQYQA